MTSDQINRPEVMRQLHAAFERYEQALLHHDVALLNAFFWNSAQTVRYGVAEHGLGIESIRRFRAETPPVHPGRTLSRTVISTFGTDTGSVCTEFHAPDTRFIGRQTQTWIRLDSEWRIVAAHVSLVDPDVLNRYC